MPDRGHRTRGPTEAGGFSAEPVGWVLARVPAPGTGARQIAATADLLDTSLMAIVLAVTDSHDTGSQVESVPGATTLAWAP